MASLAEALKQYGYVGTLANSVPELRSILAKAVSGSAPWSVQEFTRAVQDSRWWKNNADSIKQYQILRATKPGEFQQQRGEMVTKVRRMASQLGVGLGEGRGSYLGHIVDMAMQQGWDDATIQQQIAQHLQGATATFGGQAGTIQQQLKQLYNDYGLPYSSYTVNLQTRNVLSGAGTVQGVQAQLINAAKAKYGAFAKELDSGMTLRDIADPYVQQMAQTLELPPNSIMLTDSKIQKALTSRDPKSGQPTATPMWQFEIDLKNDPRWDKTKNAVNSAYDQALQIGRDWGFIG